MIIYTNNLKKDLFCNDRKVRYFVPNKENENEKNFYLIGYYKGGKGWNILTFISRNPFKNDMNEKVN